MNIFSPSIGRWIVLASVLLLIDGVRAWNCTAANPVGDPTFTPKTVLVDLELTQADRSFGNFFVFSRLEKATFKKIPANSGRDTQSWNLIQGTNKTGLFLDCTAKALYLDLNNNEDLTDDPQGVFTLSSQFGKTLQCSNIVFPLHTSHGLLKAKVDFLLTRLREGPQLFLRSFYQGRLRLDNLDMQVGMVFASSLQKPLMLLRPYTEKDQPFSWSSGLPELFEIEKQIFLRGTLYEWDIRSGNDSSERVQMVLKPLLNPTLGEIRLKGAYIHRLVLQKYDQIPLTAILDDPPETIRLPTGQYFSPRPVSCNLWLQSGPNNVVSRQPVSLSVSDTVTNKFWVGGPLSNVVTYVRRGNTLVLSYALKGAGDRTYMLPTLARGKPLFTIYQGDRKVFSGSFEYG